MSYLKSVFLFSMCYVTLIGWSSNGWVMVWFSMEVVFLVFIGFTLVDVNYSSVELVMKYFIVQSFISLMFSGLVVFSLLGVSLCVNLCFAIVLVMKLGMFPFHYWIIMIQGKLDWLSFLVMSTLVKLLPLLIFYYLNSVFNLTFILALSFLMGSVLGLGNLVVQKLLGYSSLVHLCWLLVSLSFSLSIFFFYFSCYLMMMIVLVTVFYFMNIYYVNQFKLMSLSVLTKFFLFFFILSFAGFPPFMGFVVKWFVLSLVFFYDMKVLCFILVFFSLFSVMFYLELFYYVMMIGGIKLKWYECSLNVFFYFLFLVLGFYFVALFMF